MTILPLHRSMSRLLPALIAVGSMAAAQVPGISREQMWPAPTAEDWAKPCLVQFQRSYEAALEVSRETGRPILVCVNMDGEIASEHYAGIRYRDPEMAKIYEPYVCVIASVYRHNPRDYDEEGRRILCPRFGSVTCGEHIWIEPGLFEKFLDGERVAPRHIGVELDGKEMYDVYYAFDTDSVFSTIREGIEQRDHPVVDIARGDRPIGDRVTSQHIEDQEAVEQAYVDGDRAQRQALLEIAVRSGKKAPVELLRLAIFGLDVELAQMAREALTKTNNPAAVDLIAEALRVPMQAEEREALIAALERLGENSPKAQTLAVVHRGLANRAGALDVDGWAQALEDAPELRPAADWDALESRLAYVASQSKSRAQDAASRLEFAEASLALAVDPNTARVQGADGRMRPRFANLMFEDARRDALEAERLGESGWRVDGVIGIASYYLGDRKTAFTRCESAVAALPSGAQDWNAMAVLSIYAEGRQQEIARAVEAKEEWPPEWLADVHAAYSVLGTHPLGADTHVVSHHDFLRRLGARGQAGDVLVAGLQRFPDSWDLHARLRTRILEEQGLQGFERVYEGMLAREGASPNLHWYAGYASLVTAEFHRRGGKSGPSEAAYDRAVAHYENAIAANPESRASADHYVAMAIAGRARLALEREEYERALSELLDSFQRRPDAAGSLDGLGLSPVATAKTLRARLADQDRGDLVVVLDSALASLDPKMLEPAPFEPRGGQTRTRDGRRELTPEERERLRNRRRR